MLKSITDLFWSKVDKNGPTQPHVVDLGPCWEWSGPRSKQGYGDFKLWNRTRRAHRFSWALVNGPIPEKMFICHRCDNPPCVRPDHLFVGTPADNNRDMTRKGRVAQGERHKSRTRPETVTHGERHHNAKMDADFVRQARERHAAGETITSIARGTGINRATIAMAVRRKAWKHVV